MIELDEIELKAESPKKDAKIDQDSTSAWRRKTKEGTTEIERFYKRNMKNAAKKPAGSGGSSEITVVEKANISKTNPKSVVCSGFNDQLRHKLPFGYTKLSMKIEEVSCS